MDDDLLNNLHTVDVLDVLDVYDRHMEEDVAPGAHHVLLVTFYMDLSFALVIGYCIQVHSSQTQN